jgi:integrase
MANRKSTRGDLSVKVVSYGRTFLSMYYVDPITEKRVVKSTGTANKREAERIAGQWEKDLLSGAWQHETNLTWQQFREKYEEQVFPKLKPRTREIRGIVFNLVEEHIDPARLASMTPQCIATLEAKLRAAKMTEGSIGAYLPHLQSALNWAVGNHYLQERIKLNLSPTVRRGRAVTGEEFDRMTLAAEKVRPHDSAIWTRYLQGLWLSGLRLSESLILSWDLDAPLCVDMSGKHVRLRIAGDVQKSGKDQLLPLTPDFADFLSATPKDQRHGLVFPLMDDGRQMCTKGVSKILSAIGKRAKVNTSEKRGAVKWASAHDLRRAFGTRWARRVMPAILKTLMRHSSITTTMRFYVAIEADEVADQLDQFRQHFRQHSPQNEKKGSERSCSKPLSANDF